MKADPAPVYFADATEFRRWLDRHHASHDELWIGFYKKAAGRSGLTYLEAVEESLCFGWIDGVLRRVDDARHIQRFTPRRPGSNWSNINIARVERLIAAGRMHPAGLAAFQSRDPAKSGIYSFERKTPAKLPPEFEQRFRRNKKAWTFFNAQAPWYQRVALHKVVSPKQAATRERWLERLINDSAAGRRIASIASTPLKKSPVRRNAKART